MATWFVFALLWLAFAWIGLSTEADDEKKMGLRVRDPVFQRTCEGRDVTCVDDCSFLCVEPSTRCVGGVCRVEDDGEVFECDESKGGMRMLVAGDKWICLCTDESVWGGPACDRLNPDVCERGSFVGRDTCLCPQPYRKFTLRGKVHCVGRPVSEFFAEMEEEAMAGPRRK